MKNYSTTDPFFRWGDQLVFTLEGPVRRVVLDTKCFNQSVPMERAFAVNPRPNDAPPAIGRL